MTLRLVHNNSIGAYSFMLFVILILGIRPLVSGGIVDVQSFDEAMPLWKAFSFTQSAKWAAFIFSALSVILVVINLTRFNSKYSLLSKQSALPGYIFIMLVAAIPEVQQFNPNWLVAILFIIGLEYLFEAHNYRKAMKECFVAAFWLSVASLLTYKILLIFPLLVMLMVTLRLIEVRTLLASLIGFVLPWLFYWGYALAWGSIPEFLDSLKFSWEKIHAGYKHDVVTLSFLLSIGLLFILSLFSVIRAYGTKKIYTRKQYLVFIYTAIYIIALILISGTNFSLFPILAMPLSILIAHFLDNIRSTLWQNIYFMLLVIVTVTGQILL